MTSIHRQLKTCFVFPNGDGGYELKVLSPDGEQFVFPLTIERAALLARDLANAVHHMVEKTA